MTITIRRARNAFTPTFACRVAIGCAVLTACHHLVDPPLPPTAVRLIPPIAYERWWRMVETCSAISGNLGDVNWYYVPDVDRVSDGREMVDGYWSKAGNQIVLPGNEVFDGELVRHEMLHALLQTGGHPRKPFLDSCGGVAGCESDPSCVADAGPPPEVNPATQPVSPGALEVSAELSPAQPTSSIDGGFFTYTVFTHNPANYPVVVTLPIQPGAAYPIAYPYTIRGAGGYSGALFALDQSRTYFRPGETKQQVFDFGIGPTGAVPFSRVFGRGLSGIALPGGDYTFQGAFGDHAAPDITVTLSN